jgi:hypothetical protein
MPHCFHALRALIWVVPLCAAIALPARADDIVITYGPAGSDTANTTALCTGTTNCDWGVENFSSWNGGAFTSHFTDGGSSTSDGVTFTGDYALSGTTTSAENAWVAEGQNAYGGVDGHNYPELFGPGASQNVPSGQTETSYTINLSATNLPDGALGVNYFGVWISALDPYNDLLIFNTSGQEIAEFDSPILLAALGSCSGGHAANAYCGNPLDDDADSGELFAFVNVFDLNGTIGSVELFDSGGTGFESDNDTVAYLDPVTVNGTFLSTTAPEPASIAVFGSALLGLLGFARRRRGV